MIDGRNYTVIRRPSPGGTIAVVRVDSPPREVPVILEMHCHSEEHSSCSTVNAALLVQHNFDRGLPGTVLTDHHYLWPPEELAELRLRLKIPDYYVILSGQEVSTADLGDVLVYGADVSIETGTPVADIRARFPEAAIVLAHPYRWENVPTREELFHPAVDGVEIFNSNHTVTENSRGLRDWHRHKFTAIAGTDAHAVSYAGAYPTIFDHPVQSVEDLAREIRAGRCRPFFKELPRSGTTNARVTEIVIGTKTEGIEREKYIIKTHENIKAWNSAAETALVMEEISKHGFDRGVYRIPRPLGHDRDGLSTIEQGIQGKTLHHMLVRARPEDAGRYLKMAARWLARLHNCGLQVTPPEKFLQAESGRLERYLSAFYRIDHPHTRKAREISDNVLEREYALYDGQPERLVQGHGDFHPKNIFIGHDTPGDPGSEFVAAIDFDSSYTMPPAFDVGTFLAQYVNQFFEYGELRENVPEDIFLHTYLEESREVGSDFLSQVELFRARTSLSICYYLVKVGLGDSENLWRVLVEADQRLARLSVKAAEELP